ncbi:glycosyltransferase [Fulvivirga sediminis]|uniref:Glycosyltransferase n=1 Tax=Fulvivirga sediminis TaxID=2803949 RepID=A0A937FCT3_9BACT|nr:glycosyltransferase [Fulvivirga sediminis]MBL3658183.1 glycosyltransferase [Fulvivirga sediminis]
MQKQDNRDIVILALTRSDAPYSSTTTSLAKEFSKHQRVFLIDNPVTWAFALKNFSSPIVKRRIKAFFGINYTRSWVNENLIVITMPLMLPINFLPAGKWYDRLARFNNWLFMRRLKKVFAKFNINEYLYLNFFNPFYTPQFPKSLEPKVNAYYTLDDISQSAYVSKHGPRLEKIAFEKSHISFGTSKMLTSNNEKYARIMRYLPNAANIDLFRRKSTSSYNLPAEYKGIEKDLIVFTGHLDVRNDDDIINKIAESFQDKILVIVGFVSWNDKQLARLTKHGNVLFTGSKPIEELPHYLHYAKCAIIPFKCNKLTNSIYPLKINEYLAAGLPVVSTPFSEDIRSFEDVISIEASPEGFVKAISQEILHDSEDLREKRIRYAESNSWSSRAQSLRQYVEEVNTSS